MKSAISLLWEGRYRVLEHINNNSTVIPKNYTHEICGRYEYMTNYNQIENEIFYICFFMLDRLVHVTAICENMNLLVKY
jgi:hypothetical protein